MGFDIDMYNYSDNQESWKWKNPNQMRGIFLEFFFLSVKLRTQVWLKLIYLCKIFDLVWIKSSRWKIQTKGVPGWDMVNENYSWQGRARSSIMKIWRVKKQKNRSTGGRKKPLRPDLHIWKYRGENGRSVRGLEYCSDYAIGSSWDIKSSYKWADG